MALAISMAALAAVMIALVGIDSARRGRNWLGWSMATAFFGVLGLAVWLIRRRGALAAQPLGVGRGLRIALTAPLLLGLALVVVTWVTTFVVQVARIEGQAMAPALNDGDGVLVSRLAYRYRAPRPGDVVMLYYPLDPDKVLVLRVAAEEGDQIRIRRGRVFRNDTPQEEPFVPAEFRSDQNWGPEIVPEGYYFVLADHRNLGIDSRHWKYVPRKYIVGRIALRWWPFSEAQRF